MEVDQREVESKVAPMDEPATLDYFEGGRAEPPMLSPEDERRLWRKVDVRLVPIIILLYVCSFLDKSNIGKHSLYQTSRRDVVTCIRIMQEMPSCRVSLRSYVLPVNNTMLHLYVALCSSRT